MSLKRLLRENEPQYYVAETSKEYYIRESNPERENEEWLAGVQSRNSRYSFNAYFLPALPPWYYEALFTGNAENALGLDHIDHGTSFIFNWVKVRKG